MSQETPEQKNIKNIQRQQALQFPHNVVIADHVLNINSDAFSSTVTLGYTSPTGIPQPAVSIVMSTKFMKELADQITAKIAANKASIQNELQEFTGSL